MELRAHNFKVLRADPFKILRTHHFKILRTHHAQVALQTISADVGKDNPQHQDVREAESILGTPYLSPLKEHALMRSLPISILLALSTDRHHDSSQMNSSYVLLSEALIANFKSFG